MVKLYHSSARQLSVIEPREQKLAGGVATGRYVFASDSWLLAHAYCLMGSNLVGADIDKKTGWCFAVISTNPNSSLSWSDDIKERVNGPGGYIHHVGYSEDDKWTKPNTKATEYVSLIRRHVLQCYKKSFAEIIEAGVQIYFVKRLNSVETTKAYVGEIFAGKKSLLEVQAALESRCGDVADVDRFENASIILLNDYLRSEPHSPRPLQQLSRQAPASDPS